MAVGPEGFTRAIQAVEAAPCCHDPHWAAGFERAVLTLVAVQVRATGIPIYPPTLASQRRPTGVSQYCAIQSV